MPTRLYFKDTATEKGEKTKPFQQFGFTGFERLHEIDPSKMGDVAYITIEEYFWKGLTGYCFVPGVYEGEGFEVNVSPSAPGYRGQDTKNVHLDYSQNLSGRFDTLEIAIAFWSALTRGEILPTRPICRELSVTEQVYAKQAAAGVAAMAKLGKLEAKTAQMLNHLARLEQVIQDKVLTPVK